MNQFRLFLACFFALIATAFGFIIRAMVMNDWAAQFGLSETQKGEIAGVGLWPFAISIVLFSLVIDRIGYGKAMIFALVCHIASAVVTMCAPLMLAGEGATAAAVAEGQSAGYWMLFLGNLIVALGNGTVEAVINPVVATIYSKEKTKWLNILHAGWPGGLVLGGLILLALDKESSLVTSGMLPTVGWEVKVGLIFIPVIAYALLLIGCKFPVNERVAANVSYMDMLREFGALGALIVASLIVFQVGDVVEKVVDARAATAEVEPAAPADDAEVAPAAAAPAAGVAEATRRTRFYIKLGISLALAALFGAYTRSLGRPLFVFMLLIMIPLATTELGTDSWIGDLMTPIMKNLEIGGQVFHLSGGWVLIYTSLIMMILRFFAGPIVHRISPLGLLAMSSILAAAGLWALSSAAGVWILAAATLYGFGKTFFWPTMLGVVSEQSPKGGALTLNATGGVGMLAVGVVGTVLIGFIQDKAVVAELYRQDPVSLKQVVTTKAGLFGEYETIDPERRATLSPAQQETVAGIEATAKQGALKTMAIFPLIMLLCYLILILYFRSKGGYRAQTLDGQPAH